MSDLSITGVTVSVEFGYDEEYGRGTKSSATMEGKYTRAVTMNKSTDAVLDGLDLYFSAWKSILTGRFTIGRISGTEYKDALNKAQIRLNKAQEFLKTNE